MLGKIRLGLSVAIASLSFAAASQAALTTSVSFTEAVVANHTSLVGSNAFAAQGLSFTGSATYTVDSRFTNAGGDDKGITTGADNAIMGVVFATPAISVTFSGLSISTDFYATVFDANGGELDNVYFPAIVGQNENYFSHTFSDVGNIGKIEFHDHNLFIGVGAISFTVVPEPTTISLLGLGAMSLLSRARRR